MCFRESKLTRILQPYLGGNSFTAIICNIHPLISNYQESLNTLRFALCAGGIKNNVKINISAQTNFKEMDELAEEVKEKNDQLQLMEKEIADITLEIAQNGEQRVKEQEEIDRLSLELKELRDQYKALQEGRDSLAERLQILKEDNDNLDSRSNTMRMEIDSIQQMNVLDEILQQRRQLEYRNQEILQNSKRLESEQRGLLQTFSSLKSEFELKREKVENLKSKNSFFRETSSILSRALPSHGLPQKASSQRHREISNLSNISF